MLPGRATDVVPSHQPNRKKHRTGPNSSIQDGKTAPCTLDSDPLTSPPEDTSRARPSGLGQRAVEVLVEVPKLPISRSDEENLPPEPEVDLLASWRSGLPRSAGQMPTPCRLRSRNPRRGNTARRGRPGPARSGRSRRTRSPGCSRPDAARPAPLFRRDKLSRFSGVPGKPAVSMSKNGVTRMTDRSREIYRASNGDRWSLARDPASGEVCIRHDGNLSSGAHVSFIGIGAFLCRGQGPEQQELLQLIGTLIDVASERTMKA